jgi:hypothetical protein
VDGLTMDIKICEIHGKFEAGEWNDWQCPKCEKEIMDFGRFAGSKYNKNLLNKEVKAVLKRAGMKL